MKNIKIRFIGGNTYRDFFILPSLDVDFLFEGYLRIRFQFLCFWVGILFEKKGRYDQA